VHTEGFEPLIVSLGPNVEFQFSYISVKLIYQQ